MNLRSGMAIVAAMIVGPAAQACRRVRLQNANALLSQYDRIFTLAFQQLIERAVPALSFARGEGVMLGDGRGLVRP